MPASFYPPLRPVAALWGWVDDGAVKAHHAHHRRVHVSYGGHPWTDWVVERCERAIVDAACAHYFGHMEFLYRSSDGELYRCAYDHVTHDGERMAACVRRGEGLVRVAEDRAPQTLPRLLCPQPTQPSKEHTSFVNAVVATVAAARKGHTAVRIGVVVATRRPDDGDGNFVRLAVAVLRPSDPHTVQCEAVTQAIRRVRAEGQPRRYGTVEVRRALLCDIIFNSWRALDEVETNLSFVKAGLVMELHEYPLADESAVATLPCGVGMCLSKRDGVWGIVAWTKTTLFTSKAMAAVPIDTQLRVL